MRFQVVASIVLLVTLAASVQGLFVSKKLSTVSSVVGGIASGATSGATIDTAVVEDVPVHIERRYRTIHVPATVYSYASLYPRPVYYTAVRPAVRRSVRLTTNIGGVGRSIGNLIAAKGAIGSALGSSGSSSVVAAVSTY